MPPACCSPTNRWTTTSMTDRSRNDLIALTDESGPPQQFLCYGGVFALRGVARSAERLLVEYCSANGFADREMSWKKC